MYCALIGYIWYEAEPEEKNFLTLLELINASEAREDDEEFQSPVDILFAKLEKEHPDHFMFLCGARCSQTGRGWDPGCQRPLRRS